MKHFHEGWAITYVCAALIGLALGSILYPTVFSAACSVAAAVGLR